MHVLSLSCYFFLAGQTTNSILDYPRRQVTQVITFLFFLVTKEVKEVSDAIAS